MQFLADCAHRLEAGESSDDVLASMKRRYTTTRSLDKHTCLVRSLYAGPPSDAFVSAVERVLNSLQDAPNLQTRFQTAVAQGATFRHGGSGDAEVDDLLKGLPSPLPTNVTGLRVTREEKRDIKVASAKATMKKNAHMVRVRGREMLADARSALTQSVAGSDVHALALLLLTGRRTCELFNGSSTLTLPDDAKDCEYVVKFSGQAKRRRRGGDDDYLIPTLAPAADVVAAWTAFRNVHSNELGNTMAGRLHQSRLRGAFLRHETFRDVGHVHGLRGTYACMALRLFDWGVATPSYVAMIILGHTGLQEAQDYMVFHIGDGFDDEPHLGDGAMLM